MKSHPRHKFFLRWLIVLPFIFFFQITTCRAVFSGIDILKQHIPMKFFNAVSFQSGVFPLWNPILFKGYPHFAEGQSGPLYIGNILMYLAPANLFIYAYSYTVILHFVLGGLLCYAFFRRKDLNPLASFFASISITFSPFMLLHSSAPSLHQVAVFFPLLLMIYDASIKRPLINIVLGSMVTSVMLLMGHVQMVMYCFIALAFYALFVKILSSPPELSRGIFFRSLLFYIVITIWGSLLAAIQLIPTMELSNLTYRVEGAASAEFYSIGSWLDISKLASIFFIPALEQNADLLHYGSSIIYFGVLPVLLMFIAWRDHEYRRKALPWLLCFAVCFFLAMGWNNPLNQFLTSFPPFNLFRYLGRMSFFAGFFLVYPLALAIQIVIIQGKQLIKPGGLWNNIWREIAILMGLVLLMSLFIKRFYPFYLMGMAHYIFQLIIAIIFIALALKHLRKEYIKIAVFVHLIMFLLMGFMISNLTQIYRDNQMKSLAIYGEIAKHKYENKSILIATDRAFISADDINNYLLTPSKKITYDAAGSAGLYSPWGIANMNGYTPLKMHRWEVMFDYIINSFKNMTPNDDTRFLEYLAYDTLGINYLILTGRNWSLEKYSLAVGPLEMGFDKDTYLYIAKDEHPGYFLRLSDSLAEFDLDVYTEYPMWFFRTFSMKERAKEFVDPDVLRDRHVAIIEIDEQIYSCEAFRPMQPSFPEIEYRWDGFIAKFTVDDPDDMFDGILLHQSYYPDWYAYVNDKPVPIYIGDGVYKFIELGYGEKYEVELQYFPRSFRLGLIITLVSFWIWVLVFVAAYMKYRKSLKSKIKPVD